MWIVIGTIAIVAAMIGLGIVVERRLGSGRQLAEPKRDLLHAPGAAPASAIRGGDLAELRRLQCCDVAMDVRPDDRVTFGDRELLVLHFICSRCNAKRSVYVDPST